MKAKRSISVYQGWQQFNINEKKNIKHSAKYSGMHWMCKCKWKVESLL